MELLILKDRLQSARYAYLTSKTDVEAEQINKIIRYLEHQIRDLQRGEIPEEVLE
jgi:predicted RNA-binding protein with EMAP domain